MVALHLPSLDMVQEKLMPLKKRQIHQVFLLFLVILVKLIKQYKAKGMPSLAQKHEEIIHSSI